MGLRKGQRSAGTFQKGKSGNPLGRAVVTPERRAFRELAKEYTPEALAKIVQIMSGRSKKLAFDAAVFIVEQGHGKAKQTIEQLGGRGLSDLSRDELLAIAMGALAGTSGSGAAAEDGRDRESPPVH